MTNVHVYNLRGIREAVYAALGWGPKASAEAKQRVDEFINRAYFHIALEMPFCFFSTERKFQAYPDFYSRASGDELRLASGLAQNQTRKDPWCLETVSTGVDRNQNLVTDGTLGGRKILLWHPTEERWLERTIRQVFEFPSTPTEFRTRITLVEPIEEDVVFPKWRVRRGGFNLPRDVIEIKGVAPLVGGIARWIEITHEGAMRHHHAEPIEQLGTGVPREAFRREYRSLQAPTFQPELAEVLIEDDNQQEPTPAPWAGPEPVGKFQYVFTYTLGKHEGWAREPGPGEQGTMLEDLDSAFARRQPWLESPPSPMTDVADVVSLAVGVELPNLSAVLAFDELTTPRFRKTGMTKRIYRRRITDGSATPTLEAPDRFYLIDEVDAHETFWVDDGTKTPDYLTPLRIAHGYQSLEFRPTVGVKTDFILRYVQAPLPLTDDQDTPVMQEAAVEALILLAAANTAAGQGATRLAFQLEQKYEKQRDEITKRFGTARPASLVTPQGRARVGRGRIHTPFDNVRYRR